MIEFSHLTLLVVLFVPVSLVFSLLFSLSGYRNIAGCVLLGEIRPRKNFLSSSSFVARHAVARCYRRPFWSLLCTFTSDAQALLSLSVFAYPFSLPPRCTRSAFLGPSECGLDSRNKSSYFLCLSLRQCAILAKNRYLVNAGRCCSVAK